MSTHRTSLAANTARIVWGVLALALLVALLASVFLSRGTIDDAEADAQARAVDWANTVLFDALTPEKVQTPILGPDYRELLITVQAGIRSDDRTARVRIWNADGVLVFSDDQRDKIGEYVATDNPQIEAALSGTTVSVPTQANVAPKSGLAGAAEKLFQTFVPLRLDNQLGISGVVQIDQRYASIEAEATDVWQQVRLGLVLALTIAVGLFLFTFRTRPLPAGAEEAAEGLAPARQDRRALERAAKAEDQLRLMMGRAETAEAAAAEAEASVNEAIARLRELEERATRAEERAGNAEAALQEAAQRMTGGEAPRRGVPGVGAVAVTAGATETEARLQAAETERERLAGELGRVRAALAEREAELALAREGVSAGGDEVDKVRGLAAEHEGRAAELERRVTEVTRDAADAHARIAELEGQLQAAEAAAAKAAAATTRKKTKDDRKVASDLRAAQLEVNDLQMKLAEAQAALKRNAELETKAAELETRGADLTAKAADLETAHARTTKELEAARAELAKADAELGAARDALAGKDAEATSTKGAVDRAAAVEAALAEMEARVGEIEARATASETRAAQTEAKLTEAQGKLAEAQGRLEETQAKLGEATAARSDLAAEFERVRSDAVKAPAPAAEGEDAQTLRLQITELEEARRADVVELQRAQEALANTQFESTQARRRVKELEERLEQLQSVPAASVEEGFPAAVEESTSFASRLAHLVREHEPVAEEPAADEPAEVDEAALSLRERLARAAAARHRAPGAPSSDR